MSRAIKFIAIFCVFRLIAGGPSYFYQKEKDSDAFYVLPQLRAILDDSALLDDEWVRVGRSYLDVKLLSISGDCVVILNAGEKHKLCLSQSSTSVKLQTDE